MLHHDLGDIEVFVEPHRPHPGSSSCRQPTSPAPFERTSVCVGYHAVIVEPRAERLVASDEPHVGAIEELELGTSDVVVLTDHDAPYAATVLAAAARSPARFVGMMSSRRHVVRHLDALRALGLSEEEVARVHAPVGLDIGVAARTRSRCRSRPGSSPTITAATADGWTDEPGGRPHEPRAHGRPTAGVPAAPSTGPEPMGRARLGRQQPPRR